MTLFNSHLGLNSSDNRLTPKAWGALMIISLVVMLPGFFNLPTMDRDEARYSQATRQMMETGDYIDIRFQDQARHVKPAGIYWMQVVTTAPFGGTEAPQWAHRLPSLFGCLAAVALTAWFGARIGGAPAGFSAGVLIALCLLVSVEARTAKTDAALLAAITFAQVALYYVFHPPDTARAKFVGWPLVFWIAHGAGLMIKGPIITLVSVATIIPLCLWRRDWGILKRLHIPLGLVVMLAVVMPWLITITVKTQGGFIEQSLGHAFMGKVATGDDSHGAPPGYHTVAILLTYWPGVVLLAAAAAYGWARRKVPMVQFLLCWIIPTWIIFELVATKLPHYTLPVFPAIAIMTALALSDARTHLNGRIAKIGHWAVFALFVVVTGLLGIVPYYLATEIGAAAAPDTAWLVTLAAVLIIAAGGYLVWNPSHDRLLPLAAATALFYVAIYAVTMPVYDRFWLTRGLQEHTAQFEGCDTIPFSTLGYREPSVVFNFGTDTLLAVGEDAIGHLEQNRDCGVIAVSQNAQEAFTGWAVQRGLAVRSLGAVEGFNYVKGDELTMTFYVLESSPIQLSSPAAN